MKNKLASKIVALILCVILTFGTSINAFANYVTAALIGNTVTSAKWMSQIKDDVSIADLSLPGTHDSATKYIATSVAGAWTTTQDLTIAEQLNVGVRYLDLRLAYDTTVESNIKLVHSTIVCTDANGNILSLKAVFNDLYTFLNNNPTETVVVSVKEDAGDAAAALADSIENLIDANKSKWFTGYSTPKLGDVRGKCVLTTRIRQCAYGISLNWGDQGSDGSYVDYGWFAVQDRYSMGADSKWANAAKLLFDREKPEGVWQLNFLSTTGGGISGVGPNASTMNTLFSKYEMANNKSYGVVFFDYVSENLAKKVYKCNDRFCKNQPKDGQYYYRINLNTTQPVASGWTSVALKLYYKENNGTGQEHKIMLFDNTDPYNGYHFVCNAGNFDFSGIVDGFPTKVEFQYDWGYGAATLAQELNMYVGASPSDNLTKLVTNSFVNSSYISTPCKGIEFYSSQSAAYPVATSVEFENPSNLVIQAPSIGNSTSYKYTQNANVYDQYGVKWYEAPTSYYLDKALEGITLENNVIYVDQRANANPYSSSFNIIAKYQDNKSVIQSAPKNISLNTNEVEYTFKDYDGSILMYGSDYVGTKVNYSGATPVRKADANCHYTFRGWSKSTVLGLNDNVYVAQYTATAHSMASYENTKIPSCCEGGVDTYVCSCGYTWTEDFAPLGHNLKTDIKPATCLENGYKRIYCSRCDYVESHEILYAFGHDKENAILGEYVPATDMVNGYQTYYCPRDNVEILELRTYDANDWSGYYSALKKAQDIQSDKDYSGFNNEDKESFESAVNAAMAILNEDENAVIQSRIDAATNQIVIAIDDFSEVTGSTYYTLSFVRYDGTVEVLTVKAGTSAMQVNKPDNSPYLITDTQHTAFRWGVIKDATSNATYYEYGTTSNHTFNTYIYPSVTTAPTCIEKGTTVYKCLCGYEYVEYEDALGHNFADYTSNDDGTHTSTCQNDSKHARIENCEYDESFTCRLCGYHIDLSALDSQLIVAGDFLNHPQDYEENSLNALADLVESVSNNRQNIQNQKQADDMVTQLQECVNALIKRNIDIDFYVVINGNPTKYISEKHYLNEKVKLSVSSDFGSVYKWSIGADEKIDLAENSLDVVAGEKSYYAYIDSAQVLPENMAKIEILNKNGRTSNIVYVKKGTYSVNIVNGQLILGENEYAIGCEACPFYDISGYFGSNGEIDESITISDDEVIGAIYQAKTL